ncbi:MAG: hypothetical protein EBZ49_12930 [Proteobacteria bacterium]|jgi:hypothetical protein|nr:hypothetical protein [Pseudomonadota bacterium]
MPSIDIIQNLSLKFSDFIKDNLKDINKLPQKQKQGISKAIRAFKVVLDDISENTIMEDVKLIKPGSPVMILDKEYGGVVVEIKKEKALIRTKNGLVTESIYNLQII